MLKKVSSNYLPAVMIETLHWRVKHLFKMMKNRALPNKSIIIWRHSNGREYDLQVACFHVLTGLKTGSRLSIARP